VKRLQSNSLPAGTPLASSVSSSPRSGRRPCDTVCSSERPISSVMLSHILDSSSNIDWFRSTSTLMFLHGALVIMNATTVTVVVAVGTRANPLLTATCPDLKLNRWGNIEVDASGMTSLPGVFAGGDIVRGAATVILAMGDGKRAARAIDAYLTAHPSAAGERLVGQPAPGVTRVAP